MSKQQSANRRRSAEAKTMWANRKGEIVAMYHTKSQQQIADHYGLSLAGIQKVMKRLSIKPKSKGRAGKANGRYKHGLSSTLYRKMVKKKQCVICAATTNLCVHHINENHLDNRKENLEVQCMSCHSSKHKQDWWDARKKSAC